MLKLNQRLLAVSFVFWVGVLPLSTANAVSDEVAVQLLERLSELELEISNLRGENEVLRKDLTALRAAQRTGFLNIDKRISNLEQQGLAGQTATNTARTAPEPAAPSSNTANATPALGNTAAEPLPTPGTIVARPSAITLTSNAEAALSAESTAQGAAAVTATQTGAEAAGETSTEVDSDSSGDPARAQLSGEEQRRATVAVDDTEAQATAEKIDPNSPDSYYFYGTQDRNAASRATNTRPTSARVNGDSQQSVQVTPTTQQVTPSLQQVAPTASAALPTTHQAKAAYNEAYKLLVNDTASAIPAFRAFINDYPEHEFVANAQYWLGEALYAQQDFAGATEEFMQVLKNHKSSPKAPGAALKLGYSFYELRQWDFARRTLEDTVRFFPETNAARLAANRLERMQTENR